MYMICGRPIIWHYIDHGGTHSFDYFLREVGLWGIYQKVIFGLKLHFGETYIYIINIYKGHPLKIIADISETQLY